MLLAIVPARGGSQRIKNKNIVDFCGKPLIRYSLDAAADSGIFDEIHVSTDNEDIKNVVERSGIPVPFMRAPELADHMTPLVPVLQWVIKQYEARGRTISDVCLLMPTTPLILPTDLSAAYALFKKHGKKHPLMAVATYPVPIEWALEADENDLVKPVFPGKANIRSQDLTKKVYDAGSFVFFTKEHLLDPSYPLGENFLSFHLPKSRAVDIDDQEDLELASCLYRGLKGQR